MCCAPYPNKLHIAPFIGRETLVLERRKPREYGTPMGISLQSMTVHFSPLCSRPPWINAAIPTSISDRFSHPQELTIGGADAELVKDGLLGGEEYLKVCTIRQMAAVGRICGELTRDSARGAVRSTVLVVVETTGEPPVPTCCQSKTRSGAKSS